VVGAAHPTVGGCGHPWPVPPYGLFLPWWTIEDDVAGAVVNQEMAAFGPRDHGDSEFLGELQAHVGDAGAGQEYRDPHRSTFMTISEVSRPVV